MLKLKEQASGCRAFHGATGFLNPPMPKPLAEFQRSGEALAGQLALAEAQVGHPAEVQSIGLSPGILAIRLFGAVERIPGILQGFARVAGGEVRFGEGQAEIDGVFPEAASVRQEGVGFAFRDGLTVIAEVALEFAGGMETAELEFRRVLFRSDRKSTRLNSSHLVFSSAVFS